MNIMALQDDNPLDVLDKVSAVIALVRENVVHPLTLEGQHGVEMTPQAAYGLWLVTVMVQDALCMATSAIKAARKAA